MLITVHKHSQLASSTSLARMFKLSEVKWNTIQPKLRRRKERYSAGVQDYHTNANLVFSIISFFACHLYIFPTALDYAPSFTPGRAHSLVASLLNSSTLIQWGQHRTWSIQIVNIHTHVMLSLQGGCRSSLVGRSIIFFSDSLEN